MNPDVTVGRTAEDAEEKSRESKDSAIVPEHRIVESVCSGRVGSGRVGRRESN